MSNKKSIENQKPIDSNLIWFGIRADTGRPVLERVDKTRCGKCKGFGTYGNPLCGALYYCTRCKGTGHGPGIIVRLRQLYEKISIYLKSRFQ
jgi:hypothetical protein